MEQRTYLLRADGTALVIDLPERGLPRVLHWGADLGDIDADDLAGVREAVSPPTAPTGVDEPLWYSLLPSQVEGWRGHPGLSGHHDGVVSYPDWTVRAATLSALDGTETTAAMAGGRFVVEADDPAAGLRVRCEVRLETGGFVRVRHAVTNTAETVWTLDGLLVSLPLPAYATELLDLSGRWCRERVPQRQDFTLGTRLRASRRGRTGHDAPLLLVAGAKGFGFGEGEVWGVHTAWSGDHAHLAERLPENAGHAGAMLGGGELTHPGEIRLGEGETYQSPWVCFSWSDRGLDGLSGRVHRWLRSRRGHPGAPRPVVLNTWEAVYFDHDLDRLRELADTAAGIGVERFVLDDGWFLGRRDDSVGLGDWTVDPEVWPRGLHPLFDHVRSLGMQVGLWVEPEMVNTDSELLRAHPSWALTAEHRRPLPARWQHVLDLSRPEVAEYVFRRLDALVTEYRLDYLKWDHNRDFLEAVHATTGRAGVHRQTEAAYALLDRLRARHPGVEIESCSSGGGRVDLGILDRTDRVWASDTNDALERLAIQRWTMLLLPPELVGSHVGGTVAHTTGRTAGLAFRCLSSLIAHAGIEWDITRCTAGELETLRRWIALYRELRPLLHTGDLVRADLPDSTALLDGVVAPDRSQAVFVYARTDTSESSHPGRVRLPGLDPLRRYRVRWRDDVGEPETTEAAAPPWFARGEITLPGAVPAHTGLQMPNLRPAQAIVLHAHAVAGAEAGAR